MANVPYQIYKTNVNGNDSFYIMPATNTPYGAQPATAADVVQASKQKLQNLKNQASGSPSFQTTYYQNQYNQAGGDAALAKVMTIDPNNIKPEDINALSPLAPGIFDKSMSAYAFTPQQFVDLSHGGPAPSSDVSWGKDPLSGQMGWGNWDKFNADEAQHAAAVAAGTEKKVPMGNGGYSYVPTGSAADQLLTNPPPPQQTGVSSAGSGGQNATDQPAGGAASTQSANSPAAPAQDPNAIKNALDIINNSTLDEHTKDIYRQAVQNWDPTQEVNIPNILKTFTDIKSKTIDPYYKELTNGLIDQYQRAYTTLNTDRGQQLEAENVNAGQAVRNTQNNLEATGMTFTGAGVEQLGAKSAFAQPGQNQNSAIPLQTPFGGQYAEGIVNQGNRLISSASQAKYMDTLTDLSRQAEQKLGTAGSSGLIPGVKQLGGIDQSAELPNQKSQNEASTLSNLYNQEQKNVEARKPLDVFKS